MAGAAKSFPMAAAERQPGSGDMPSGEDDRGRRAEQPSEIPATGWKDIAVRVKDEIGDDHTVLAAAGVAFYGFLSAVPALAALVSIYGLFASPSRVEDRVEDLFGALPADAKDLLSSQLENVVGQSGGALTTTLVVSVLLSLWSASSGMGHLLEGINIAYDEKDTRNFVVRKAMALAFTLGALVFVVVAIGGIAALPAALGQTGLPDWAQWAIRVGTWPVLVVGFGAGLAVLYRYAPKRDAPQWRWVTWGSVVAVTAWIVASILFRIYANNFGSYNETYGSLAAVVVLLMWLFISAFVVLLGAQINAEMEHQTAVDTTEGAVDPMGQRDAYVADTLGESADEENPDESNPSWRGAEAADRRSDEESLQASEHRDRRR